jgi:hypothetical protein
MDRLHLSKIPYVVLGTKGGELPDGLAVGSASVGIADVRAEKVA